MLACALHTMRPMKEIQLSLQVPGRCVCVVRSSTRSFLWFVVVSKRESLIGLIVVHRCFDRHAWRITCAPVSTTESTGLFIILGCLSYVVSGASLIYVCTYILDYTVIWPIVG